LPITVRSPFIDVLSQASTEKSAVPKSSDPPAGSPMLILSFTPSNRAARSGSPESAPATPRVTPPK
jgi:hypothetical protein